MRTRIKPLIDAFRKHIRTLHSAISAIEKEAQDGEKEALDGDTKESEAAFKAFKALTEDMGNYLKLKDLIDDDDETKLEFAELRKECNQLQLFCAKPKHCRRVRDYEARLNEHMDIVFHQLPLHILLMHHLKYVCELNQEPKINLKPEQDKLEQDAYVTLINILGYYHYVITEVEKNTQDTIQRQFVDTVLSYQLHPPWKYQLRAGTLQSMCTEIFDKSYQGVFQVVIPNILDKLENYIAESLPQSSQQAKKHQLQYDFAMFKTILRIYASEYASKNIYTDEGVQFSFRRHLVNIVNLCEKYGQEQKASELKMMTQDIFGLTYDEILTELDLFVPDPPPPDE